MKKRILSILAFLFIIGYTISAQETISQNAKPGNYPEKFGNTLNLGVGIGYHGYINQSIPVFHANFEFNIVRNFTLAPFISVYTYQNYYYWGNKHYMYRNYSYRETVIPVGAKATYYFDELFRLNSKWDVYVAGSLGVAIRQTNWEKDYYGDINTVEHGATGLFLDAHTGAEFHISKKIGLFLDISTGVSTFGLAIHL